MESRSNTKRQLQLWVLVDPFGGAELLPGLLSLPARLYLQHKSIPGIGVIGAAERPDQKQNQTGNPEPRRLCEEQACRPVTSAPGPALRTCRPGTRAQEPARWFQSAHPNIAHSPACLRLNNLGVHLSAGVCRQSCCWPIRAPKHAVGPAHASGSPAHTSGSPGPFKHIRNC